MATKLNKDGSDAKKTAQEVALDNQLAAASPPKLDLHAVDMSAAGTYRKPHTIRAVQLGKDGGDWVAEDARGNRWVITNEVFMENYSRV